MYKETLIYTFICSSNRIVIYKEKTSVIPHYQPQAAALNIWSSNPLSPSWHLPTCDWICYRVWNTFSIHSQLGLIFVSFLFTWLHLFVKLCLFFLLLLPLFSNWAQVFNQLILLSIDISCSSFHALLILVICVFYSPLHLLLGLPLFLLPSWFSRKDMLVIF